MDSELTYTDSGWAVWPADLPRPGVELIRQKCCELIGTTDPRWEEPADAKRGRNTHRALVAVVARQLLGWSYPESASAAGYKAHSTIINPQSEVQQLLGSEAGCILYNAAVAKIHRDFLDTYQMAARRALGTHAGSAV